MVEDRPFERLQFRGRFDAKLLRQSRSCAAVDLERFGLPTQAIERKHELSTRTLPERILIDQLLKLCDYTDRLIEFEAHVDQVRSHPGMQLPEAPDLRLRELLKLELGQRLTTPKSECPTKQIVRRRVVAVGECLTSLDGELLETINIQLSRPNAQQITRRGRRQALLAEALAKTRDIDLDVLRRCRRRLTQSSSISRSLETGSFACKRRIANRAFSLPRPIESLRPSSPATSSSPISPKRTSRRR